MTGQVKWQGPPTAEQLQATLRELMPEAADARLDIQARATSVPSRHRHGIAFSSDLVIKFAWSLSADRLVLDQARVLKALAGLRLPIPLPLAVSSDPALLVYRRLPGRALLWTNTKAGDAAEIVRIGPQLGELLAQVHDQSVLRRVEAAGIVLPPPLAQSTPDELRRRMFPLLDRRRVERAKGLVDTVERVLHQPAARRFLHGDFHGHNLLLSDGDREVIGLIDFEEAAAGDPAYDLRYLPGLAPTLELLSVVMKAYARATGSMLDLKRVLAWHVLTDMGDALWRTEQGVEVVDGALARRFDALLERIDRGGW